MIDRDLPDFELEHDLWSELEKLTGKRVVMAAYDPAGRGPSKDEAGRFRLFPSLGVWLAERPETAGCDGRPYAVGDSPVAAISAAITRALAEASRG